VIDWPRCRVRMTARLPKQAALRDAISYGSLVCVYRGCPQAIGQDEGARGCLYSHATEEKKWLTYAAITT
jgi:hypothetical protein